MNEVQFSGSSVWIPTLMLPGIRISIKQIHGTLPIFTDTFFMVQFNIIPSYTHAHRQAGAHTHALRFLNVISVLGIFKVKLCVNLLFSEVSCTSWLSRCNHVKNIRWKSQIMQFLSAITSISQVNMFSSNNPMFLSSSDLLFVVKLLPFHFHN
jgi:hypothetical protein